MGVDHGGLDVLVAEQLLHAADVGALLEQASGKGMPKGVEPSMLIDSACVKTAGIRFGRLARTTLSSQPNSRLSTSR